MISNLKHLGQALGGQYSFSDHRGDRSIGLPVIVTESDVYWFNPRGPYGVELEGCGGGGDYIGWYHVFADFAAREAQIPEGSPRYLVTVTDYDKEVVPADVRKKLLAGADPRGGGTVYPAPGGWVTVAVRPADKKGMVPDSHLKRIVKAAMQNDFWHMLNQQLDQPGRIDEADQDAYREWYGEWQHAMTDPSVN